MPDGEGSHGVEGPKGGRRYGLDAAKSAAAHREELALFAARRMTTLVASP